jgi:hypothetical protein
MANYLKTDIYKKSYLIEFMDEEGKEVKDSFTFSVPPESEELTYSQRKSETKTFGGLHVDDYGIDAVKIALSGSTINQDIKRIYRPGKSDKWLTGEEEIYHLRDLLEKYKTSTKNIVGVVMLYDLSKSSSDSSRGSSGNKMGNIKNYWRVFPGDFKIRRASDKPFTYKYSIEFTGIQQEYATILSRNEAPELSQGKLGLLQSIMNGLVAALDFIDSINGKINDVLAKVNEVSKLLKTLGNVMNYATNTLTGAMNSVGDTAAGLVDGATSIVGGVHSIVSLPRAIQQGALNIGLDVFNATKGLMQETASLADECRRMFDPDGDYWQIPQEVLDQYNMTNAEFKDSINVMLNQAEDVSNELVTAAKSGDIPDVTIGNPPMTGNVAGRGTTGGGAAVGQTIVLSYGFSGAVLKDTDTLESLATEYFGSPDRAIDIATYNGITSLGESNPNDPTKSGGLSPGDTIKIPILQKGQQNSANRIYSRREDRDNYGRDIYLDDKGYTAASTSGDYKLTDGANNLSQAILLRLRESVKKRIRLSAYGIRSNISDPTAGVAYILSSIDLTVRGDPRVKSIDDIQFVGIGDSLNVTVDYRDINNANGGVAGSV